MKNDFITKDHDIFYTTSSLSENMETTPEGYLLCRNVPIARVGVLFYGGDEVPVEPDAQGVVQVERFEEDLFNPETLASLVGKSVTIEHPDDFVGPDNWKDLTVGSIHNPRRGEGADSDLLLADLLITDGEAIELIRSKKLRQVSCGYNAVYKTLGVGRGRQCGIIYNHVALVGRGRCGERCAVQDEDTEGKKMDDAKILEAQKQGMESGFIAACKAFFSGKQTRDESSGKEDKDKARDSDEVAELKKEIAELKAALAKTKEGTADNEEEDPEKKEKKTGDAMTLDAATVSEIVSTANIIMPGYKPTADALKSGTALKRDVLVKAHTADAKKEGAARVIENFTGENPDFTALPAATIDAAFVGTGGLMKSMNNSAFTAGLLAPGRTTDAETLDKRFDTAVADLWKE